MLGPEEVTDVLVNGVETVPEAVQTMYGIIPRATLQIFDIVGQGIRDGTEYSIKCSYIEIYNEAINDILCSPVASNLKLREFPKLGMCVIGMTERFITEPEEVFECLSLGTTNRIVCATGQNTRSSRSHTVFIIVVEQKLADGSSKISKLNLVDLAGSEKLSKTGAKGQALKEAQNINLSLTTLGRCIKALTSSKDTHVPFRESKLTQILKESLGGNSKTSLLCTASGKLVHKEETLGTLAFAERAKRIKNKATSNVTRSAEELMEMVEQLKGEVIGLRSLLKVRQDNPEHPLPAEFADHEVHFRFSELVLQHERLQETSAKEIDRLQSELERAVDLSCDPLQVRELEDEIIELRAENQQVAKRVDRVRLKKQAEIETLTSHLQENTSMLLSYQQELTLCEERLASTKHSLLEKEDEAKQTVGLKEVMEDELRSKQQETAYLRQELMASSETNQRLEQVVGKLKQQVTVKEQQIHDLQQTSLVREGELSLTRLEETRLRAVVAQLEQDKSSSEMKIEDLRGQSDELRGSLDAELKKLQVLEQSSAEALQELQGQLEEQGLELSSVKSRAQALEIELQESYLTHQQLEEREALIAKLQESHEAEVKALLAEQEQTRSRYDAVIVALQGKFDEMAMLFEAYRAKADIERLESLESTKALEAAQQTTAHQNIELEFSVKRLTQELATSQSQNAAMSESLKQQKAEFVAMVSANRDLMLRHTITLQTTKAISDSHSKKLEEIFKELADARAAVGSVELNSRKELSRVKDEIDKLQSEIRQLKQQVSVKEATVDELRKKNSDLEKALASAELSVKQAKAKKADFKSVPPPQARYGRRGSINPKINSATVSTYGAGMLNLSGNKYLKDAIEEARSAAQPIQPGRYKQRYGYQDIKSIYADTEIIEAFAKSEESKSI
jgi:kinesin family protein 5